MFADKIAAVRQSLEMKGSVGAKNVAVRDSNKIDTAQYSIDAQISQNNKKILQAFKQNSGYYHVSPKKQKSSSPEKQPVITIPQQKISEQCPRIYLFGKNGDYFSKPSQQPEQKTLTSTVVKDTSKSSYNSTFQNSVCGRSIGTSISNNKNEQFIKEVLQTLGIINANDVKLQFNDLLNIAYARFVDMKSNGRWQLIQKYFKGVDDQDLSYSCATNNRSIIKKKSIAQTGQTPAQPQQKKKVKVVQPQTASQLMRTKQKLAQQLQINIKKLTKGYKFNKYCYNKQKVEQIIIYLSYDMKCLAWQVYDSNSNNSNNSKQPIIESMLNYNGITQGSRSKNYQKYVNKRYKIDQQLAFSIMLKNRTLDLMAHKQDEKMEFIEAIKFVKTFI